MSEWIVIPAFNEAKILPKVIAEIQKAGYSNIILVDDGSRDNTYLTAKKIPGVVALRLIINRGKGAAVKTGMEAAKLLNASIVVTLDADGQHNPEDIHSMLRYIREEGYDVVLGSRLLKPEGMPLYKILHNKLGNFFVWMLYGLSVTDSQSGFRAYSKKALQSINTQADRYEYDSEIIREINRHKLRFIELPITVRYTDYSMSKPHKMDIKNGIKTLFKMILSL